MRDKAFPASAVAGLVVLVQVAAGAHAASFDCSNARSAAEKTICSDPQLSQQDDDYAAKYSSAITQLEQQGKTAEAASLREQAKSFLRLRNECDVSATCMRQRYQEMMEYLSAATVGASRSNAQTPSTGKNDDESSQISDSSPTEQVVPYVVFAGMQADSLGSNLRPSYRTIGTIASGNEICAMLSHVAFAQPLWVYGGRFDWDTNYKARYWLMNLVGESSWSDTEEGYLPTTDRAQPFDNMFTIPDPRALGNLNSCVAKLSQTKAPVLRVLELEFSLDLTRLLQDHSGVLTWASFQEDPHKLLALLLLKEGHPLLRQILDADYARMRLVELKREREGIANPHFH
jgi:uncharacterized protein